MDTVIYNSYQQIAATKDASGRTVNYLYDTKGGEIEILINGNIHSKTSYANDGSWTRTEIHDDGNPAISRVFYREFNASKEITLDSITEEGPAGSEVTRRYTYDGLGRTTRLVDSTQGIFQYHYPAPGVVTVEKQRHPIKKVRSL